MAHLTLISLPTKFPFTCECVHILNTYVKSLEWQSCRLRVETFFRLKTSKTVEVKTAMSQSLYNMISIVQTGE